MIVVDSSVWVDYFNGQDTPQTAKLDALLGVEPLAIGEIIGWVLAPRARHDKGELTGPLGEGPLIRAFEPKLIDKIPPVDRRIRREGSG